MLPRVCPEHIRAVRTMALSFPNFSKLTDEIIQDLWLKLAPPPAIRLASEDGWWLPRLSVPGSGCRDRRIALGRLAARRR